MVVREMGQWGRDDFLLMLLAGPFTYQGSTDLYRGEWTTIRLTWCFFFFPLTFLLCFTRILTIHLSIIRCSFDVNQAYTTMTFS